MFHSIATSSYPLMVLGDESCEGDESYEDVLCLQKSCAYSIGEESQDWFSLLITQC